MKNKIKESETNNVNLEQPEETEEPKIFVREESFEEIRKRNKEIKSNINEFNNALKGAANKPYEPTGKEEMNLNADAGSNDGNQF